MTRRLSSRAVGTSSAVPATWGPVPSRTCRTSALRADTTGCTGRGSDSRPTTVQPTTPRGNDLPPPNLPPPGGFTWQWWWPQPTAAQKRRQTRTAHHLDPDPGLDRVPRRRAALGLDPAVDRRRRSRGRPARGSAGRHLPARRVRQPQGPDEGGTQGPHHRKGLRRARANRHDPDPPHRRWALAADVDPARLTRADRGLRHHQDQRGLRLRWSRAPRADDRAVHRPGDRRLRRDRLRRPRQGGRRARWRRDLPEEEAEGQGRRPRHRQGLPERRRQDGSRLLPHPQGARHR